MAYYLIHSMEPSADGAFPAREWRAAQRFADRADPVAVGIGTIGEARDRK